MTTFSFQRVGAMTLRYSYLLRSSYPRMLEMIYWPLVQMLTWGFLQIYLVGRPGGLAGAEPSAIGAGSLVGAVLLWDILLRGQQGFSFSFLEEMWARNLPNLFMSPLRPAEFVAAMMAMSLMRLFIGMVPVTLLAIWFFGFNLWALGLAFAGFFAILILFAWSVGLFVAGLLLRYGLGAENLVWSLMFVIQPLGCVYYPVAVLPSWLQPICWMLPPTYVFEGLRGVLIDHALRVDLMAAGLALDAVLFTLAAWSFTRLLRSAREAGSLLQTGE
ncbi:MULTISPECIES: ABC transporter permease [Methylosinus]|uniref:Transport permease protein n=1 Tax=Methylosinus trichosporium (strain ATCC 35070 / NCIMB 11131 / UNIQEM 75 / OB3b) TaxID=595536 RepID=A0A2D2D1D8_METT3|nr:MULTISPECIES: ABC transporter permease [Methylosinus]ATQ68790.1 ABC transporter permease [Methylosinus trichosporium OB3b]OBS51663.1 ABC transporter [Methylosinus sp. 3S-1]